MVILPSVPGRRIAMLETRLAGLEVERARRVRLGREPVAYAREVRPGRSALDDGDVDRDGQHLCWRRRRHAALAEQADVERRLVAGTGLAPGRRLVDRSAVESCAES